MMVVGILDDEIVWVNKIKDCIKEYFVITNFKDYEIITCLDENELNKNIEKIDLLFLDVELNESENGFEIAERIQKKEYNCKICFLTSHIEYARMGYKVNAYRYIDKYYLDEINEALATYNAQISKAEYIECKNEEGADELINIGQSLYIELIDRKLCYSFAGGKKYFSEGKLKNLAEKYESLGFIQVQRSYLVNMKYIRNYDSRHLVMIDDTQITISRDRLQFFKKKYFDYRKNNID